MKKIFKVLGYTLLILILVIAGSLIYIKTALPNVGAAPVFKVEYSKERIERGRYLANSVTVCMDCHSTRDWTKFAGPLTDGTLGKGGERFDQKVGFPGVYYSKNITPAGISRYTDGELFRLITTGVTKEGRAMFPVMPYGHYGRMDPEDIKSIIAYIRMLSPIQNPVPESVSDFPMNFIINTIPTKASPHKMPSISDQLAYGAYMVNASACIECHTQVNKGSIIPELAFSGGREFNMPNGSVVRSANLTTDAGTGIGNWTEEAFINRFRVYADSAYKPHTVTAGEFNSIMPWNMYSKMTKEDLTAIYRYLKTVKPIKNKVEKFTPSQKVQ
ncbi:MAG: cytochrome c-related protein [Mucilaginibacter sp.]|nr:cytochrome c-related protein [Mucilaginibacter sp.]